MSTIIKIVPDDQRTVAYWDVDHWATKEIPKRLDGLPVFYPGMTPRAEDFMAIVEELSRQRDQLEYCTYLLGVIARHLGVTMEDLTPPAPLVSVVDPPFDSTKVP